MVRDGPAQPAPPPKDASAQPPPHPAEPYPAEKARGGEIVLRTRTRRTIFVAGLVGIVVLVVLTQLFG
ncbi:hypothetical protein PQJ75_22210 [Rhodoplanes sp. TEM]|uniref:Peptide ABC transporter permease n=1 Tax=Rhodoplanes tepidamans TaxID=200616 RepID=A0ABT5JI71_RHOTP|nr:MULTISPECIES: hypothetical protein [Rhodoplanes]MDC7789420.1 hypothetical protein [Rhodoplanes tepidamans]MDC7986452.1 hypothetical protein [Rhodoplanes sp. TEM]MDQ0358944.1 hypothetical protein [Rhodoplanes tepidamans]